jgi:hypothetical protein
MTRLRTLLVHAATAIAACGDSPTVPSISGSYQLQRVTGGALPAILSVNGADTARVTGGTLTVSGGGEWTAQLILSLTSGATTTPATAGSSGTYVVSGTLVTMRDSNNGSTIIATTSGTRLTANFNGANMEFERR